MSWLAEDQVYRAIGDGDLRKTICPKRCSGCCSCCLHTCCRSGGRCASVALIVLVVVAGLIGGAYYFLIYDEGPGFPPPPEIVPDVPDPPDAPGITLQKFTSLGLSWNQPAYHKKVITKYELQQSNDACMDEAGGDASFTTVCLGRQPACLVFDLSPGSSYVFRVRAINAIGASNYSNTSCWSTLNASAPATPGQPSVEGSSEDSLSLRWHPSSTQGINVSGYEVEYRVDNAAAAAADDGDAVVDGVGADDGWASACMAAEPLCVVHSLQAGTAYAFRGRALTEAGLDSTWTFESHFHTDYSGAQAPQAPTEVHVANESDVAWGVTVAWDRPKDGGSEVVQYELDYKADGKKGRTVRVAPQPPFANATVQLADVLPSTTYAVRARAVNGKGESPWSDYVSFATPPAPPPSAPGDLYLKDASHISLTLAWGPAESLFSNITSYQLQRDDWWVEAAFSTISAAAADVRSFEADRLLPASQYHFRVRAASAGVAGAWAEEKTFITNAKGGCGNPADMQVYFDTKTTMKGSIQGCIIGCAASDAQCAVNCIHDKIGLSIPCAQCWGDEAKCTLKKCLGPCIFPGSAACENCSQEKCFPACVDCSGVPMWAFPP